MIRVVIDTNVLISALLQPQGLPAQVLLMSVAERAARLCVSGEVYAEYEEVIRRPRFKRSESEIADTLRAIREIGIWVKPSHKVRACIDPDDDVFLECAQAARAHYIVTGNVKDFPAKWADTLIVTPHQFLDAIAEIQDEPHEP
jgi:putative PIN family toxin of toxin-antitoxin system